MENSVSVAGSKPMRRDISIVTAEIKDICAAAKRIMLYYAIEIGRRLVEAKDLVPHGGWSEYLKSEVEFSQRTASNYMKLYEEYGDRQISLFGAELNSQAFANLDVTKAIALLAVPTDEREEFAEEVDAENISTRELEKIIKERDAALKKAKLTAEIAAKLEKAETAAKQLSEKQSTLETDIAERNKEIEQLQRQLESKSGELREKEKCITGLKNGVDDLRKQLEGSKEGTASAEEIEKYKAEGKAEAEKEAKATATAEAEQLIKQKLEAATKKTAELESALDENRRAAEEAEHKIKELQKQLRMANPAVTEFKTAFEAAQDNVERMLEIIDKVDDEATKGQLKRALRALLDRDI